MQCFQTEFAENRLAIRKIRMKAGYKSSTVKLHNSQRKMNHTWQNENSYNLVQNVADKFTKLSKRGFSMDCFTADFLRLFTEKCQNLGLGGRLGTCHQIQAFQGFS